MGASVVAIQEDMGMSFVAGNTSEPLRQDTLGSLLKEQADKHGDKIALVSWTGASYSYKSFYQRCIHVAQALLASGVRPGDHVGIFAENCEVYVELFFATALISTVSVVLNCNYAPSELASALIAADCKWLFTSTHIGPRDIQPHLDMLEDKLQSADRARSLLQRVFLIRPHGNKIYDSSWFCNYDDFLKQSRSATADQILDIAYRIDHQALCNLQFTSGTTGSPKAAMLTHSNLVNNGQFIGDRMRLTTQDIICSPPPLFHCFGLVLCLMASWTHGSSNILSAPTFDAVATLDCIVKYSCTIVHGVPTMLIAVLDEHKKRGSPPLRLRGGIGAGASVPRSVIERLQATFGFEHFVNTYGMTETSPASFMLDASDPLELKLGTVGRILPHTIAKIIDASGRVVPRGVRGEVCVAGYLLQKGYYKNDVKTAEAMKEEDGRIWMYTGDEGSIDKDGYCSITGRIKDIIIRGGENIFPLEVEERLMKHPAVSMASVVGLKNERYGEAVAAFLIAHGGQSLPSISDIRDFSRQTLSHHKTPAHIFWVGSPGSIDQIPMTASGKVQKNKLREWGDAKLKAAKARI